MSLGEGKPCLTVPCPEHRRHQGPPWLSCLETAGGFLASGGPDYFRIWKKLGAGEKFPKQSLDVLFSVFMTFQITVVTLNGMERYGPKPETKALSSW